MKIVVFKEYDGKTCASPYIYRYGKDIDKASLYEKQLKKKGIKYKRKDYDSVLDFLKQAEEVRDGFNFSDGDALDFVLEVLGILEI